jgi:hypothetical protein
MADSQNEALVRRFFDKLNAEDLEGLRPILHPQATWTPMSKSDIPGAGVHVGHKGIIDEFLKPVRGLFEGKDPQNSTETLFGKQDLRQPLLLGRRHQRRPDLRDSRVHGYGLYPEPQPAMSRSQAEATS